jgi:hypothetical protein
MRKVNIIARVALTLVVLLLLFAFLPQVPVLGQGVTPPKPESPDPDSGSGAFDPSNKHWRTDGKSGWKNLNPPSVRWGERVPSEPLGGFGAWGVPAQLAPPGEVRGYVMDLSTGKRAEQIKLKINDAIINSDWDGYFSLTSVPEGDYVVELLLEPGQGYPAQEPVVAHVSKYGVSINLGFYSGEKPAEYYIPEPKLVPPPAPPALVMPAVPRPVPYPQAETSYSQPGAFSAPLFNSGAPLGAPQWGQNPYYAP